MYSGGYTGKILRINLTDQTAKKEKLPLKVAKDFIGGAGFGVKFLFDEVKARDRSLKPGEQTDFCSRAFYRNVRPLYQPSDGYSQISPDEHGGNGLVGWVFPCGVEVCGLRHHYRRRVGRKSRRISRSRTEKSVSAMPARSGEPRPLIASRSSRTRLMIRTSGFPASALPGSV